MIEVSEENIRFFLDRTVGHIHRVQLWMLRIAVENPFKMPTDQRIELVYNATNHDHSKFSKKQAIPYLRFSASRRDNVQLDEEEQRDIDVAYDHHIHTENHHPHYDLFKSSFLEAIEIACDLQAMADEFGQGSGRVFFQEKWKKNNSKYYYDDHNYYTTCDIIERCFDFFDGYLVTSSQT